MNAIYELEMMHPSNQRRVLEAVIGYYSKDLSMESARKRIAGAIENEGKWNASKVKEITNLIWNHYV